MPKVKYIIYMRFNRDDSDHENGGWRAKKTLRKAEWWKHRAEIMERYVLPSLKNQSFQDFTLWTPFKSVDEKRAKPVLDLLNVYGGVIAWENQRARMLEIYKDYDYLVQIHLDSDDMYARGALKAIRKVEPSPGLVMMFRKGFMYHGYEQRLWNYEPGEMIAPFFALVFTKTSMQNESALQHYWSKWRQDVLHYQLLCCPNKIDLPDWLYCYIRHGRNTSPNGRGDPSTWRHYGKEILDTGTKQKVLARFGGSEND